MLSALLLPLLGVVGEVLDVGQVLRCELHEW